MTIQWLRGQRRTLIAASTTLTTLAAILVPLPPTLAAPAPQSHVIEVNARAFAYEPATMSVRRGDTVTLHLESLDTVHGLYIDGYDVDIQAEPGKSAEITFVADREGKFKVRCSIACGPLHPFMLGELTVEPNWPFDRALIATVLATIGALAFFWSDARQKAESSRQ